MSTLIINIYSNTCARLILIYSTVIIVSKACLWRRSGTVTTHAYRIDGQSIVSIIVSSVTDKNE